MKNNQYIREFELTTARLNKDELEVLNRLVGAAKLMANVYQMQLNERGMANFYPKDATRAEIERAASLDDQILSPHTVVERNQDGKLVASPYHIKYRSQLEPIAEKLLEVASITKNKEFANALRIQAKALLTGKYNDAQIAWMKIKPYVLQIVIGPIESVEDELFFVKRAYEAWVGVMNKDLTDRAVTFKDTAFSVRRRLINNEYKVEFNEKAQIRVDDTVVLAGHKARYLFTAATLPNDLDIDIIEKYGTESTVFLPAIREVFRTRHYPLFNAIFAPHFRQSFSQDDLRRGHLYTVMMHETARVLIRYRFAVNRLRELYPIFAELTYEASGIKLCGSLLLKDAISQKEMESILVMFLTRIFDYYFEMKDDPTSKAYVLGNAMILNSLRSSGALQITKDGISWPNFTKMFIAVSNLADEMEKVLAESDYKSAQKHLDRGSSLAVFQQFKPAFDKAKLKE